MTHAFTLTVDTDQEAFDAVVRHLAAATVRAADMNGCAYLTSGGLRCAVGALLDDPSSRAVELPTIELFLAVDDGLIDVGDIDVDLLQGLQGAHDVACNWSDDGFVGWDEMRDIADTFGLSTAVLCDFADVSV